MLTNVFQSARPRGDYTIRKIGSIKGIDNYVPTGTCPLDTNDLHCQKKNLPEQDSKAVHDRSANFAGCAPPKCIKNLIKMLFIQRARS